MFFDLIILWLHFVFRGYDSITDYNILYIMFRKIEDIYKPLTFQHVHNSVLRNIRFFLVDYASVEDRTFFESLAENADIIAMFKWIFDLIAEHPEAVNKFTVNLFSDVQNAVSLNYDVNGKKMTPSYKIKLQIFYRWVSKELFDLLRYILILSLINVQKQNTIFNLKL